MTTEFTKSILHVTHCMLKYFYIFLSSDFVNSFSKLAFSKNSFRNTIRASVKQFDSRPETTFCLQRFLNECTDELSIYIIIVPDLQIRVHN